jgi:AcrR family transcriptional regulator
MAYVAAAQRREQMVAAARIVLERDGVAATSLRAVAAEAGVPLGTMQYAFRSKELLLRAVIEDVVHEIAEVLKNAADREQGLAHAIRHGLATFWAELVSGHAELHMTQYELAFQAQRTPGLANLARRQYELYTESVAEWCQAAAEAAGESCAIPFDQLARLVVGGIDGLIIQGICAPDSARSRADVHALADMLIAVAGIQSPD